MNRALTLLLCVLAVGAVIFIVIYEPLTTSTREQAAANLDGRVLSLDPAGVHEIRITSPSGELDLKRHSSGWQIGPKPKDRGDADLINQLLTAAGNLKFFDRISGSEFKGDDELSKLGLRSPKRKIEFLGNQNISLYFGKDGADEDRMYVRRSDSRDIFLVNDDILQLAFADVAKFRDRRLTDLQPEQIDRFLINKPDGQIEISRSASGWQMVRPLNAPADEKVVNEFLGHLLGTAIQDFVADDSGDLGSYGIAEGSREITFYAEGNDRHQTLRLGTASGTSVLAQFTPRDSVYRLPAVVASLLQFTPDSFRDRHLLPLNLDLVDVIRIHTPQQDFALQRKNDGWEVRQGGKIRPANSAVVQSLADAVAAATATSYLPALAPTLASSSLTPPRCTVDFVSVLSENTPEAAAGERVIASLSFGRSSQGQVFAHLADSPEIALLPDSILKAIPLDSESWAATQ